MTKSNPEHKNLFRSSALEYQSKIHQLDDAFKVINYNKWSIYIILFILPIFGLVWFVAGTIPVDVKGVGIAVNSAGLYNLDVSMKGIIKELQVKIGTPITKGQLLATLYNPELNARYEAQETILLRLNEQLQHLQDEVQFENAMRIAALKSSIESAQYKIDALIEEIPVIKEDLYNKEMVAKKGLLSSITMENAKDLLWNKESELENTKTQLYKLKYQLKKEYREDEIKALEEAIRNNEKEKALIEAQLQYDRIYSPSHGILLEWFVQPGTNVNKGDLIARLEIQDEKQKKIIFYGYIPIENKKIPLQTIVEIELTNVNSQEYGTMLGHIVSVSGKAISSEAFNQFIQNPELIEYLQHKQMAVLEVIIEPEIDPNTPSGFRWSSGTGPDIQLTSGTLCTFRGQVEEISPLNYFFPIWRIKT